ncbi:hypothetical protein MUN76_15445 [Leucobacter rhizosphaerae]|uniref:Uncharacterized protein n=1 Tax=Leucobacter rhizosphaerae TaxID=2932245 RepID=A0ABY4FVU3_9MICO|nr:hypothetical protein [Leucobacter rhizosphaerae]UOQ60403.1 hypothetical protein MUN76_15445 [Leucobacter rhizosphaerae]
MFARARFFPDAAHIPKHELDGSMFESAEVVGEGPDWVSAKAACVIPDSAVLLAWFREE